MLTLIGIDLGTTACKVTVVPEDGAYRSVTSTPYGIDSPQDGWAEQPPERWLDAVGSTLSRAGLDEGGDFSGVTVGFTGQMHSFVMLDEVGDALRPSILWCDRRAGEQSAELERALPNFAAIAGNPPLPAFTLPQLMWVREHEPDVFVRCKRVLGAKDYLRYRATGEIATDWTDASGTAMLDAESRDWSPSILQTADIDEKLLPRIVDPVSDGGVFREILPGAHSAVGIGDQFAEAVSAGAFEPGDLAVSLGTSATLLGISDRPVEGAFCHAPEDRWLRLESLHSGAKSLEWFTRQFLRSEHVSAAVELARHSEPGAAGVSFFPFLLGERRIGGPSPLAGFVGLNLSTTLADLARAVIEGVAFELRRMYDDRGWEQSDAPMTIKGGGSRSPLWSEVVGAAFGRRYRIGNRDAAFGAAAIAGIRAGRWSGYDELASALDCDAPPILEPSSAFQREQSTAYDRYADRLSGLKVEDTRESQR